MLFRTTTTQSFPPPVRPNNGGGQNTEPTAPGVLDNCDENSEVSRNAIIVNYHHYYEVKSEETYIK